MVVSYRIKNSQLLFDMTEQMASRAAEASCCATCGKPAGNFTCRGCAQSFCTNHVLEHRRILNERMGEIMVEHDQLREDLIGESSKMQIEILAQEIDRWERQSQEIIQETAGHYRRQLKTAVERYKQKITTKLDPIAQEIRTSRDNENYVETELNVWKEKLQSLKSQFTLLSGITIQRYEDDLTPLISRMLVTEITDDAFNQLNGNITIEDNGKLIRHGLLASFALVRGRNEYSSGCHQFYFQGQHGMGPLNGLFFGISSKAIPINQLSSTNPGCGWAISETGYFHFERLGGLQRQNEARSTDAFAKSTKTDVFELLVDCDERTISLINQRIKVKNEIIVDTDKCPLPWQLSFSLSTWFHSIRLLSALDFKVIDEIH